MCTHKAHHLGKICEFSIFVAFFRPSVVFKRGAFWSAPFSENNLPYWIQNIIQSQLLTPKTKKVMPYQKLPFFDCHLFNERHMSVQILNFVNPESLLFSDTLKCIINNVSHYHQLMEMVLSFFETHTDHELYLKLHNSPSRLFLRTFDT